MSDASEICPKCQKPAASKGGGSLTQWIAVCRCNSAPIEAQTQSSESPQICLQCGKHVSAGRSGSFTQYVFRHDLCSCERPMLGGETKDEKQHTRQSAKLDHDIDSNEVELPLDAAKFPIDRYKPLTLLGRGAAGAVYLCRDRLLGKKVAVKTLNELTSEQLISFQLEAKATSRLKHPSIVAVMDFGATESGCPFMVMEYINGISLADYLNECGVLELETALAICRHVCQALAHVHDHDIFHRDLKPSNVILVNPESRDMEVHLIDFGVAKAKFNTLEPTIFQGKTVVGTPNYMSPDQVMGRSYDARSEIYSLGCMLFELLTGRPPFLSNSALETLSLHAHSETPRLADFTDIEFPSDVEEIVAKCLEKDPEDRFQNMKELEAALLQDPSLADDAPSVVAGSRGMPKYKNTALFAVAVLTIVMLGATALSQFQHQKKPVRMKEDLGQMYTPSTGLQMLAKSVENSMVGAHEQLVKNNCVYLEGKINTSLLYELARLHPNLEGVDTSRAESVEWSGFEQLKKCRITRVCASDSNLRDENIPYLASLPMLRVLQLPGTNISGLGMKCLANTYVNQMNLSSTRIAGRQTFVDLANMKHLQNLNVQSTVGWSGTDLAPMGGSKLRILNVSSTRCGDEGASIISTMKHLHVLSMENCGLTSKGVAQLVRLRHLDTLNLLNNPTIEKPQILALASMKNLLTLYVARNCLDQAGIAIMKKRNPKLKVTLDNIGIGSLGF